LIEETCLIKKNCWQLQTKVVRMRTFWICQFFLCFSCSILGDEDFTELTPPNTTNNSSLTALDATPAGRIANRLDEPKEVAVSKCCPDHQSLNTSNPKHPRCMKKQGQASPFQEILGLDLDRENDRQVEIMLVKDKNTPVSLPDCFSEFEVHKIPDLASDTVHDTWITVNSKLVTSRYQAEFDHGEFCVDTELESGNIVAVMCDACKKGIPCINMCCPNGHAFVENPDYEYDYENPVPYKICQEKLGGLDYNPLLWDHNGQQYLKTWEKNNHFLVVAQNIATKNSTNSNFFECPATPEGTETSGLTYAPTDLGTFRILINGKLEGKDIATFGNFTSANETETKVWNSENYCVVFSIPEYIADSSNLETDPKTNNSYENFSFTYMTCHEEKLSWCEKFTGTFHPIMLSISVVFLIITLLVYLCEDSLRRNNVLFSKITIGFISNLTICFIVLVDNYFQGLDNDRRERLPCIVSGYFVLYFFLGFFFWINTMSFNIWLKFSMMAMQSPSKEEENKKFWKYFVYAQGMPLLITAITAIVDSTGSGERNAENLIHHPNMGKYSCFLGSVRTPYAKSYFGSPQFIYFQVFIMILQISNMIFLTITISSLYKGWQNQERLLKITGKDNQNDLKQRFEKLKGQLGIVVRLFIIMGVPWIFELISSGLAAEHGFDETCLWRLALDMSNLLAGILIFLVIVAKKPVLLGLKAKASGFTRSIYPSQANNSISNTKATDIEMKSVSDPTSSK